MQHILASPSTPIKVHRARNEAGSSLKARKSLPEFGAKVVLPKAKTPAQMAREKKNQVKDVKCCSGSAAIPKHVRRFVGGKVGKTSKGLWKASELSQLCREGLRHRPSNDFNTIAKVVCCDHLFHGVHCEVNLLARGNDNFRVLGDKLLRPGSLYMVHVKYDTHHEDDSEDDEFTSGTILSARLMGSPTSLAQACTQMPLEVSQCVTEMLSYNAETGEDSAN